MQIPAPTIGLLPMASDGTNTCRVRRPSYKHDIKFYFWLLHGEYKLEM